MSLIRFSKNYPTVFDRFFDNDLLDWSNRTLAPATSTLPSVNIRETADKFILDFAAPGFTKEDFKIELNRNLLTVSSEVKTENETKEGEEYTCREFSYKSFKRSFTLPESVNGELIGANYTNGILSVVLPKRDELATKASRLIDIN